MLIMEELFLLILLSPHNLLVNCRYFMFQEKMGKNIRKAAEKVLPVIGGYVGVAKDIQDMKHKSDHNKEHKKHRKH